MSQFSNVTPHGLFEKLKGSGERVVLLEGGGWSFVGVVNKKIKVPKGENGLAFMRDFLRRNFRKKKPSEPPFTGGFVGFLSYDLGAKWVIREARGKRQRAKICPDAHFVYVDKVFAFKGGSRLCHCDKSHCGGRRRLDISSLPAKTHQPAAPASNLTKSQYLQKIRAIKKHLFSGDTYQVNFSQKFETPYFEDAFDLYKKMTAINPSPFQFFMETPGFAVISNSPERLFRIRQRATGNGQQAIVETRPIKGTVPRGKSSKEDARNVKKLLASPKEAAELAMIVDLERNDLGKICVPGTVEVNENRVIEKYSHVIHTVSNVRGVLEPQFDWLDAFHALFPGGSVTGCPKKRTMEIISELEGELRGIYCGSAGYIDLSGECDFNIMIRTFWLDKREKQHKLVFRSGGGIVVDSNPRMEYEETAHKAKALVSALNGKVVE